MAEKIRLRIKPSDAATGFAPGKTAVFLKDGFYYKAEYDTIVISKDNKITVNVEMFTCDKDGNVPPKTLPTKYSFTTQDIGALMEYDLKDDGTPDMNTGKEIEPEELNATIWNNTTLPANVKLGEAIMSGNIDFMERKLKFK